MTIRTGFALAFFIFLSLQAIQTARLSGQTTQPSGSTQKPPAAKSEPRPNPNAEGIYHAGDGVTMPKLVYSVEPEFSEEARKRKIAGSVMLHFIVETDGHVRDVQVIKSVADGLPKEKPREAKKDREAALTLDQQAVKAASQYRFEPGRYQGKPVPTELTVETKFQVF